MSPKSRGRPKGRGRPRLSAVQRSARELRLSDHVLRDAVEILRTVDVLKVETWASGCLGSAWGGAGLGEREPEHQLCMEVVGRASARPSPRGLAAVAGLRRVAPEGEHALLDGTVEILAASQPRPSWVDEPGWTPVAAWRAVDVWASRRLLFLEYQGPCPHTLFAAIEDVGGSLVERLAVLEPGCARSWQERCEPDDFPMPLDEASVEEVLGELAEALRRTDMTWPRQDDETYVELRALAWSRCGWREPERADYEPLSDQECGLLVEDFVATGAQPDDTVTRSLAELFLDYGDGYMRARPLGWSPGWVQLFLTDWLPRKTVLDDEQRWRLPDALRAWVRFALQRRGVEPRWIEPVASAVDEFVPEFRAALDDESAWGPAKAVAAALAERGVDLSDQETVQQVISELNAQRLAQRLRGDV